MTPQAYQAQYRHYVQCTEQRLKEVCHATMDPVHTISQAACYSLLGGGKRVRAVLTLASCALAGAKAETALDLACALEMVHCYSLIHDDLPCMDDDAMRRGRPSCHKQYDEATALLAGDALLTAAFEVVAMAEELSPANRVAASRILARAAGANGMLYGQELDKAYENTSVAAPQLYALHQNKTGAMIAAAVGLGCVAAGLQVPQDPVYAMLDRYANALGLGFQIVDDLLDVTISTEELGKPAGSDAANGKTTFVSLYGLQGARQLAQQYTDKALCELQPLCEDNMHADFLYRLAQELLQRRK